MKITSGIYKYRKLEVPHGSRPTTEKVREAVFSMIQAWLPGAYVLDLFAGSGAMGLESLSRGADFCWFCESDRAARRVLQSNIEACGACEKSVLIGKDYKSAIAEIAGRGNKLDVVIMDPPYAEKSYYETAMLMLQEYGMMDEDSIVIAEHLYNNALSDTYGGLRRIKSKKYGSIGVDVFIL